VRRQAAACRGAIVVSGTPTPSRNCDGVCTLSDPRGAPVSFLTGAPQVAATSWVNPAGAVQAFAARRRAATASAAPSVCLPRGHPPPAVGESATPLAYTRMPASPMISIVLWARCSRTRRGATRGGRGCFVKVSFRCSAHVWPQAVSQSTSGPRGKLKMFNGGPILTPDYYMQQVTQIVTTTNCGFCDRFNLEPPSRRRACRASASRRSRRRILVGSASPEGESYSDRPDNRIGVDHGPFRTARVGKGTRLDPALSAVPSNWRTLAAPPARPAAARPALRRPSAWPRDEGPTP
jgi:hypothetical protein